MKEKLKIIFVSVLFVLALGIALFISGFFQPSKYLNNPSELELKKKYKVNVYIEDNVVLDTYTDIGGTDTSRSDHYFALPCSITIDGEKYYTYVYMIDGAYTNYKENNKYSWNNQKNTMSFRTIDNKIAKSNLKNWSKEKQIEEKYILRYGFDSIY